MVGRAIEIDRFRSALTDEPPPFAVLYLHGPGGVGKTTLLTTMLSIAEAEGRATTLTDARHLDPSPSALRASLEASTSTTRAPFGPPVIAIDTFERVQPIEPWLVAEWLPTLPSDAIVIIASRQPPADWWRSDPAWNDLLCVQTVRNLDRRAAAELLDNRGVDIRLRDRLVEMTHGHPLALALLADTASQAASGDGSGDVSEPRSGTSPELADLRDAPEVVAALLQRFVSDITDEDRRVALDLCAVARTTTERLLRHALGGSSVAAGGDGVVAARAHDAFEWLASLSFVERDRFGLHPHDIVRDAVVADLEWRTPDRLERLQSLATGEALNRTKHGSGRERDDAVRDVLFQFRSHPAGRTLWDWEQLGVLAPEPAEARDLEAILAMVERHEGEESADICRSWFDRQPGAFTVYRDLDGSTLGFVAWVDVDVGDPGAAAFDPAVGRFLAHIDATASVEPDAVVTAMRFFADRDVYQSGRAVNVASQRHLHDGLTPDLTWNFLVVRDPEPFAAVFETIGYDRLVDVDFQVDGVRFAVFGHDHRVRTDYWNSLVRAEAAVLSSTEGAHRPGLELTRSAAVAAVREALRDFHRPDRLARNPLSAPLGGGEELRQHVADAIDELLANPRDARLHRALDRTYVRPAPTQEAAAEVLGLPFSTYRRHLTAGIDRLTDRLLHLAESNKK